MSVLVMRVGLGCRARSEERRVASHTSDEQRRNALQSGPQRPYTHTKTALMLVSNEYRPQKKPRKTVAFLYNSEILFTQNQRTR